MVTTCEKTASGTASRMERSQMDTAFRHVQKTALEVWMSIGLTMALYLEKDKKNEEEEEKKEKMVAASLCQDVHFLPPPAGGGVFLTVSWDDSASPAANCC